MLNTKYDQKLGILILKKVYLKNKSLLIHVATSSLFGLQIQTSMDADKKKQHFLKLFFFYIVWQQHTVKKKYILGYIIPNNLGKIHLI